MLADEGLAIAEPVGEHDRRAVLAQDVRIGPRWRVNRLDEKSKLHGECPKRKSPCRSGRQGLGHQNCPSASRRGPPGRRLRRCAAEQSCFSYCARYHTLLRFTRKIPAPTRTAASRNETVSGSPSSSTPPSTPNSGVRKVSTPSRAAR